MTRFVTASGSYSGNGGTKAVDVGWVPKAVTVLGSRSSGSPSTRAASFKLDTMSGDGFMRVGNGASFVSGDGIVLTGTGFSVGPRDYLNRSGWTFYWLAFADCPCVSTGSYVGDAPAVDQAVRDVHVGRTPELLLLFREGAAPSLTAVVGDGEWDDVLAWSSGSGNVSGRPGGFSVRNGSEPSQNLDLTAYHHLSLFGHAGETPYAYSGLAVGTGSQINVGTVRQPKAVLVLRDSGFGLKVPEMSGTGCGIVGTGYAYQSSNGIGVNADGFSIYSAFNGSGPLRWFAVHGEGP